MKAFAGNTTIEGDVKTLLQNMGPVDFKDKTALVTGGAGFLGSWICEVLIRQKAHVICLDNLSSGLESNIAHLLPNDNFEFVKHDITEPPHFKSKIDFVLHLASRASPFEFEHFPLEILRANTIGTLNALEIARKHKAVFLFASTSETYGNPAVVPTPESYYGNVNPIGARGCYDESKRCGEAYVVAYNKQYGLDIRIARIFNTYGPRIRPDGIYGRAIPRFVSQALNRKPITVFGSGEQTRSFCYVTDQIGGLLRLAFLKEAKGAVINIGNDEEITVLDLAKMIKRLTDSNSEITFCPLPTDDPLRRRPDITKAKGILQWIPGMKLEGGLRKTIDWFQLSLVPAKQEGQRRISE
jgi:UDP-glucuronate decarboxylase